MATNAELSKIFTELWDLDVNRCEPGVHYELSLQGSLRGMSSGRDVAANRLFQRVDEAKIFSRPTYKLFRALLDNYEMATGTAEVVTRAEEAENQAFLDAVLQTTLMQRAHGFLSDRNMVPHDIAGFKRILYDLWFRLYRRAGVPDSSGFEHVFVGETSGDDVIGLHNWIQFFLQEKAGYIDYKGFFPRGTSAEPSPRVIALQFTWRDTQLKPKASSFLGTSPEFELALYTITYLTQAGRGGQNLNVDIGPHRLEIVCHSMAGGTRIGTSYVKLL